VDDAPNQCRARVLLVEDNPDDALLFAGTFGSHGEGPFQITHVNSLTTALEELKRRPPDIVLLDLGLPDSTGLATLGSILDVGRTVPVAVMTGVDDEDVALQAVRAGAQDYIVKGLADNRMVARILRHAIERHRLLTELEEARRQEAFRATHDTLTGLANRNLFYDRLDHILARAIRYGDSFAIAFLDLDGFKEINDLYGHDRGDRVLYEFACRLRQHTRTSDTVARLGGDEFAVLMERIGSRNDAERHVLDLLTRGNYSPDGNGQSLQVSASYGVAMYPEDGLTGPDLLRAADRAMYRRKAEGRRH